MNRVGGKGIGNRHALATTSRAAYALLSVFLIMAAGIVTAGYLYYRNHEIHHRIEAERELAAIADLKTGEIVQWRRERLGDASVLYRNASFSAVVKRSFDKPGDGNAQKRLRTWLQQVQTANSYNRISLYDALGIERMTVPDTGEPAASTFSRRASEALRSGRIVFEDFYRSEADGRIYLNMIVPIFDEANRRVIGILAMRVDPEKYLYPLINRWPTPSRTAETLIVRREGNEVVFLNQLRFRRDAALTVRSPLARTDMPAVRAALGGEGIMEGRDYRGVPVIASIRAVPDSPWFMVARMDLAEVSAPLREKLWEVILFVAALLMGAGAAFGAIWRDQSARFYREHYKAAEALNESRERLRTIVEASPLAVIVADPEGNVTLWNNAAETTFGWSADEAVGRQNPIIPPDMVEEVGKTRQGIMDGRTFVDVETERLRKDGVRIAVSYSATALRDAGGRPNAILAIVADITERKQAEEHIRKLNRVLAVLSDTNQAIVRIREPQALFEKVCRIAVENGHFSLAWIGLLDEPSQEIRVIAHAGKSDGYLEKINISLRDAPSGYCPIDSALREGKRAVCNIIGQTGRLAPCQKLALELGFRSSASFPLTVFGKIRGAVNLYADKPDHFDEEELKLLDEMAMDISFAMEFAEKEAERARAEEALQAKNEELNSVLQQLWQTAKLATMGELASSIAHELNNPLATVSLRIESLTAQTPEDDKRRRELEIIGQEVERMGNLVTNLLQFSRQSQKQISTVDICGEIEKTLELIHYHFRKSNIHVVREFAPEVPGILADRQQLRQLFLNIFTNAGDAMPKGGTLAIRVYAQGSEGRDQESPVGPTPDPRSLTPAFVVVEIADTGAGIPPDVLPKVMEPFYTTKPEGKGTGLGLAICRRIAREHGGTLDITSEGIPGKGTKVRITLSSVDTGSSAGLTDR